MKYRLFITVFFVISLAVGLSVFWGEENIGSQKQNLAEFPKFTVEGKVNLSFTNELSDYITQSVAYHDKIISANAYLRNKLFKSSSQSQVITGSDGVLYFNETVNDYLGIESLNERELFNICDTLSQMERYCKANSIAFAFTVAPNKNTLYNADMPKRYKKSEQSNLDRLTPKLQQSGINYVDMRQAFSELEDMYYYKTDTHWNTQGAVIGYETLMSSLYDDYFSFKDVPCTVKTEHRGDLGEMLYPGFDYTETENTLDYDFNYTTIGKFKSADDIIIRTKNPNGEHSLLMFRDSFGIALFPLMAENFENVYYSRQVPVNLTIAKNGGNDTVIYEIVERNLKNILLYAPIFEAEKVLPSQAKACEYDLKTDENGDLVHFYGNVKTSLHDTQKIFLEIIDGEGNSVYYNTVGCYSEADTDNYSDSCFSAYVKQSELPENYTAKIVLS